MDRLTNRIAVPGRENDLIVFTKGKYDDTIPAEMTHDDIRAVLRRLAEYEDLEEVFRAKMTDTVCEFLKFKEEFETWLDIIIWIAKKCDEYVRAEEQGLLLRLPCKVGASVYMVGQDCGGDTLYCRRGDCEGCPDLYEFVEENKFEAYMCDDIGKTVFLTKAEAEQKLKEMESD